jgi:hypothetical protein
MNPQNIRSKHQNDFKYFISTKNLNIYNKVNRVIDINYKIGSNNEDIGQKRGSDLQ